MRINQIFHKFRSTKNIKSKEYKMKLVQFWFKSRFNYFARMNFVYIGFMVAGIKTKASMKFKET